MMNRKNIINLSFFILLFLVTLYILFQNKNSTTNLKTDAFSIADTAALTKIFIADMEGNSVTLEKNNNNWMVNNFPANTHRINLLMDVIKRVEIKNPTPESMRENVIRDMASSAIKVEFYTKGRKAFKTIYVGGPTLDNLGTFMALDSKGKEPYVVHMPGFNGYLSDGYFYTDVNEWRTKDIFNYDPLSIKVIEVNYTNQPDSSFVLSIPNDDEFVLKQKSNQSVIPDIDIRKVKSYIKAFNYLTFVALETDLNEFKQDSIMQSLPVAVISVTTKKNVTKVLQLYYRPTDLRTRVELFKGVDKEYYLGTISDRKGDLVLIQALSLERIMWKTDDFKTEK
ncbi:DUF4340 domain-containing protein [Bacteroidota bacterium]